MAKKRICVGSMFTETSHFLSTRSDLEHWRNTYVLEDDDIFALVSSRSEEGGMLARLSRAGVEVVPTLAARAISGGRSTSDCYEYIRNGIVGRIKASMPVDGVLLSLHGAMTAESEDDPEGRLLRDIRGLVGDGVPIVASLDMHAHVTEQMIHNADALVAFRNYPHDDTYETGIRAAEMLLEILSGELKPCMVVAKVPMLFSGVNGMTFGDAPMAQLRKMAIELENQHFVRSASVIHVQPTNDQIGRAHV